MPGTVRVRPERAAEHTRIADVVGAAFANEPVVVTLVELLRASRGYVPELALVAEMDGRVVGHVMFTESSVEGHDATILILSPLAVEPEHQRQGVGTTLVEAGLRRCEAHGAPLVIVEGDPRYYSRFGFRRASELGLERPHEQTPEQAFQALPLGTYDPSLRGRVIYPPPFQNVM